MKYKEQYPDFPEGATSDGLKRNIIKHFCANCQDLTDFIDLGNENKNVCSDDCRAKLWTIKERARLEGEFPTFSIYFKNGIQKHFTKVKTWWGTHPETKDYLYIEQLDGDCPGTKTRWLAADWSDAIPGVRIR